MFFNVEFFRESLLLIEARFYKAYQGIEYKL